MIYGYARVSTGSQNLSTQLKQLKEFGIEKLFKDKATGTNTKRDGLQDLLSTVKEGDTIVCTRIDRLARSTRDLLDMVNSLEEQGVALVILNVQGTTLDTRSPMGKLMITMLAGIAEFEYNVNREKQLAGIQIAKEKGVYKGRPTKYSANNPKVQHAIQLYLAGETAEQACHITGISKRTLYRRLKEQGITRDNTGNA